MQTCHNLLYKSLLMCHTLPRSFGDPSTLPKRSVQRIRLGSAEGSPKEHSNGAHWNEKRSKTIKKTLGDRTERHLAFRCTAHACLILACLCIHTHAYLLYSLLSIVVSCLFALIMSPLDDVAVCFGVCRTSHFGTASSSFVVVFCCVWWLDVAGIIQLLIKHQHGHSLGG